MGYINEAINAQWLASQLQREHRLVNWDDIDEYGVDVRLQATEHDGWLHVGDASYDTDHSGYWGASSMRSDMDFSAFLEMAADMIAQAAEHASQSDE